MNHCRVNEKIQQTIKVNNVIWNVGLYKLYIHRILKLRFYSNALKIFVL